MIFTCWVLLSIPLKTSPKLPLPMRSCFVKTISGSTFCTRRKILVIVHSLNRSIISILSSKLKPSSPIVSSAWPSITMPLVLIRHGDFVESYRCFEEKYFTLNLEEMLHLRLRRRNDHPSNQLLHQAQVYFHPIKFQENFPINIAHSEWVNEEEKQFYGRRCSPNIPRDSVTVLQSAIFQYIPLSHEDYEISKSFFPGQLVCRKYLEYTYGFKIFKS